MKINRQNTKKTKIIAFVIIAIILLLGAGGAFWWMNSRKSDKSENKKEEKTSKVEDKKTDSKKSENENKKQDESEKKIIDSKTKNTTTDRAEGTTDTSGYTSFPTYTTVQVEDGAVRVAGQISGLLYDDGNGKCSYTLTHTDGTTIELSTEILESPNNKYCKAVSKKISDNDFKSGKWTAVTTYKNIKQKQEGKSDAQSFTIEK